MTVAVAPVELRDQVMTLQQDGLSCQESQARFDVRMAAAYQQLPAEARASARQ
jgi:hypothetical protein